MSYAPPAAMLLLALFCTIILLSGLFANVTDVASFEESARVDFFPGATRNTEEQSLSSSSAFILPSRSDIISTLLHHSNYRNLQQHSRANFSSLNQIFSQVSLRLPDTKVSRSGLDLTITQLVCRDLYVGDIQLAHTVQSSTSQNLNVKTSGLKINCSFRWGYKWTIFNGSGSGTARLDQSSSATVDLQFLSENYNTHPPKDVSVSHCGPNIQIADMDFDGDGLGVIGGIMSLFEGLFRDTVEGELGSTVCEELRGLGDNAMDDLLIQLSGEMDTYLKPLEGSLADPLFVESTFDVPLIETIEEDGAEAEPKSLYLNFQQLDEYAGEWINSALDQANSFMGASDDEQLVINTFIRDNFLNDSGELTIDPSLFFDSGVVFEGHDMLTETTISVKYLSIKGLDSFTEMNIMNAIGKHTIQNKFQLDNLWIEIEMEAEMKASSKPNAVIVTNGNVPPVTERFTVGFSVENIEIDAPIFLGINTEKLGNLELGSLLYSNNIIPCLISAIDEAQFSGLSMTVQDIVPPRLSGFIDGGIDHLISTGAIALFDMYEKVLIKAMPNFFQTYVRDIVNDFVGNAVDVYRCPKNDIAELDSYVDFRELFYGHGTAALTGGTGSGRYGNVIPWVMDIIEDSLLSADDDGLLAVNDVLIAPMTKSQSGTAGTFKLDGAFVDLNKEEVKLDIWKAFADNLRLTLSDLSISGLDTLRSPIMFLEPRSSSAHLLVNHLRLGIPNKPLDASFQFGIEVGDDTSPLATNNIMDLQFSMPSMEAIAIIFAAVQESRFMKFPLKDVLNFSCWLSMVPLSNMAAGIDAGLAMFYFHVLGDITSKANCVSCSNTGLEDLTSIIAVLNENNFISGLKSRALKVLSVLFRSDWVQGVVDKQIIQASHRCPHDAAFGSTIPDQTYPSFKATRNMIDSALFLALPLAQITFVILAQKHSNLEIAQPLEIELDVPEGSNLIDLTDLSSVAAWADMALEEAQSYLGGKVDATEDLGITSLLQSFILDENGFLTIPLGTEFEAGGVHLSFYNVTMIGLDSFTKFEVLQMSGPFTVSNSVKLQKLGVKLEMGLSVEDDSGEEARMLMAGGLNVNEMETVTVSLTLKDIDLDLSFLMAMDQDLMGELQLGSILNMAHILPCFLSTIYSIGLSEFVMDIGDIEDFSISGFISEDTNESIQSITEAIFAKYNSTILSAIPAFTSTTIRPILHDILNSYVNDAKGTNKCPEIDTIGMDRYVDFWEMFYHQGGSGDNRYGDVIPWIMNIIDDNVFSANDDGLLAINDMLIGPMTESQSGTAGAFKLNGTFVDLNKDDVTRDIWQAFADNLRLTMSDLSISGLDTLRPPIRVLEPRSSSPYLLENLLSLGTPNKPLDASFQLGIEVGDATSPLASSNTMDMQFSMPSVEVLAVIFATVQESRFMKFPLKDVLNFSCWLSMIPTSRKSPGIDVGLTMHYLDVVFDILSQTECVSCSNIWLEDLNSIISFLEENNFISGLKSRALLTASDLLKGDWAQGMVDKQITQASQLCPHDAAFGSTLADQTYPSFKATRSLVDGVLYAAFPLVQVIAVAIAQKHSKLEIAPPDDIELDVPEGSNLINLTDLSSVAAWADMALSEVQNYLGGKIDDSQDLGITSMLQSFALDDSGLLTIPIVDEGFEAGGVKLSLYNVTMVGLDSFTKFEVLKTSDPNTFSNSVKLQRLGVKLEMGLSVDDESSEQAQLLRARGISANELETITVSLILKDVNLDVSFLMAMDQDLMGELQLGSILNMAHILPCLLSTIHSIGLSEFVMDIGDIEDFSISGFISEDTNQSIERMTEAIFTQYKSVVLDAIPAFTSTTIRPILHDIMQVLVGKARDDGACPEPDSSMNGILDWRDLLLSEERALEMLGQGHSPYGSLFRMLFGFLEDMMSKADENGLSKMNDLVASLTERQSNEGGDLYYPGDIFKQDMDIALNGLNAAIELGVSDVRVSNLNSLGTPIKVLQPVEGESSVLDNTASIGVGSEPLRAEFRLLINGKGNEVEVYNDLVLGLNLKSVGVMLELLAQIEEQPFLNFPLQDVLNVQCWLASVVIPVLDKYGIRVGDRDSGIVLRNLALAVAEARLDIDCIECSSPLIMEMSTRLSSQEAIEDTTEVANMILEYISNLLGGDFIQNELDQILNESAMKCPHSPSYNQNFAGLKYDEMVAIQQDDDVYGFLIAIIAVVGVSVVFAFVVAVTVRCVSRRRHNRWLSTLTRAQKFDLEKMQTEEKEREKDLNSRMRSLVRSAEVPLFIRLFIPVVILGNIALFLSGHLSLGGTVSISGSFAGQPFNVDGFFEFSMAKSTIEMWKAGAKSLAIMIVIFSGIWPYSKLLATLFIWFAPPRRLSSKRRGSILHWLDVLGKWSMVDVFVLLMTLASFRLSVESPDQLSFLPESLYSFNMLVVPLWGLYANMLAQLVAQISSHVIIHYHRKTIVAATRVQEIEWDLTPSDAGKAPEKLRMHRFKLDYEASSKQATVKRSFNWILSAVLLSFIILVVIGCALPSFSIEVLGLVGLAIESGNRFQQANVLYSVFDLASMIMDQGRYLNTASDLVGLGTLASLLVITVFIVPLAQAVSMLVQWFAPLTKNQRMQNTAFNEILSAWQYMEVYVLSIIIAAWQLGGVSEYMINAYCGSLRGTFNSLAYYGVLREEDAQCFSVNAGVETASWILVAASLMLCILNHFIVGASSQKVQDDDTPSYQRLYSDRWLQSKQSTVTVGMTTSDEEGGTDWSDDIKEPVVRPVRPRFTDYFFFATIRAHAETGQCHGVETAVLPMAEIREENMSKKK